MIPLVGEGLDVYIHEHTTPEAALFERLKVSGMVQCPTLVVMKSIGRAAEPDVVKQDPKMAYVPTSLRAFWSGPQYQAMGNRAFSLQMARRAQIQGVIANFVDLADFDILLLPADIDRFKAAVAPYLHRTRMKRAEPLDPIVVI